MQNTRIYHMPFGVVYPLYLPEVYSSFIVPCLQNSSKFQISAINDEVLDKLISDFKPTEEIKNKLKTLFEQFRLSRDQVKNKVIELSTPFMEDLFKIWNDSKMKNMSLTSVGIAIAQANFKRKT